MFDVSDAHRFRKTVAGLCMALCPVLFLASSLIAPGFDRDGTAMAGLIAESPDAYAGALVLALAGWALFLPAVLGLMHMLRERGVAEGHIGGALAILGTVAVIAQTGFHLAVWQAGSADGMAALLTAFEESTLTMLVMGIVPLAVALGALVLAWGLYRREMVPSWMAACIGLSAVAFAIASLAASQAAFVVASALLLVGFGALGRIVLSESVEDWEHTPTRGGFGTA